MTLYLEDNVYEDFDQGNLSNSKNGNNITISYLFIDPSDSLLDRYSRQISKI